MYFKICKTVLFIYPVTRLEPSWIHFLFAKPSQREQKERCVIRKPNKSSAITFSYLWPNESVQPLNGFIVVYYSIHPIHIQHNLAQSYRREEKKGGDVTVLYVIFSDHNVSWDFHILSTYSVLWIKSEEISWALKLAKSLFREKVLTMAEEARAIPGV